MLLGENENLVPVCDFWNLHHQLVLGEFVQTTVLDIFFKWAKIKGSEMLNLSLDWLFLMKTFLIRRDSGTNYSHNKTYFWQ